ncbi:hypothetical protein HML84_16635 [Alcanivorax sp. IO_7]|nr:hypothetical protein HML84_16635 [Alcanivorax sp. IO_7]
MAYLGTFSKVLHPALRLGYVVMPEGLRQALTGARRLADGYGGDLNQRALAHLIGQGISPAICSACNGSISAGVMPCGRPWPRTLSGGDLCRPWPASIWRCGCAIRPWIGAAAWPAPTPPCWPWTISTREAPPGLLLGFGALPDSAVGPGVDALAWALGTPPGG